MISSLDTLNQLLNGLNPVEANKLINEIDLSALIEEARTNPEFYKAVEQLTGFEKTPPTIDEFIDNPYYLGPEIVTVFPFWREVLRKIFPSPYYSPYIEVVISGAIGIGKSTAIRVGMLYEICCFLHRKDPHAAFNFMRTEPIEIGFCNATMLLASNNLKQFVQAAELSPFFQEQATKIKKRGRSKSLLALNLPHLSIVAGSRAKHVLGKAVLNATLCEINVQDAEGGRQAFNMYTEMKSRLKSRFNRGEMLCQPGRLWLDSSKKETTAFLEEYIAAVKNDPQVLIIEKPQWEILKGSGRRYYSGETFQVFVGDATKDPFLLDGTPEQHSVPDSRVIHVPVEERRDFDLDIYTALRDIAGISTWSTHSYITAPGAIATALCKDNPMSKLDVELDFNDPDDKLINYILLEKLPKGIPYFVHADLGKSRDAAGLAFTRNTGKVAKFSTRDRLTGAELLTEEDLIVTELVIRVVPKSSQEIPLYKFERFFVDLMHQGYEFGCISFDQAFSADLMQRLRVLNFPVEYVSLDRTREPYDYWKQALLGQIWQGPKHPVLEREIKGLIDYGRRRGTGKPVIDHPEVKGTHGAAESSKDLSDAVAGSYFTCSNRTKSKQAIAIQLIAEEIQKQKVDEKVQNHLTNFESVIMQEALKQRSKSGLWSSRSRTNWRGW